MKRVLTQAEDNCSCCALKSLVDLWTPFQLLEEKQKSTQTTVGLSLSLVKQSPYINMDTFYGPFSVHINGSVPRGEGVLDISLGGEVRHCPSYPDPV